MSNAEARPNWTFRISEEDALTAWQARTFLWAFTPWRWEFYT